MICTQPAWAKVREKYDLRCVIGKGSFGIVVRATERATGDEVAIKYLEDACNSLYNAKKVLREIHIQS